MKISILVKRIFGWLIFVTVAVLFSYGLFMSPTLNDLGTSEFDDRYIPSLARLIIPLAITLVALVIIVFSISIGRKKKILDQIDYGVKSQSKRYFF